MKIGKGREGGDYANSLWVLRVKSGNQYLLVIELLIE